MNRVIFRADASAEIGTGHVVRCRTLAIALQVLGWEAIFVAKTMPAALATGLRAAGIAVVGLPGDVARANGPTTPAFDADELAMIAKEGKRRWPNGRTLVVGDHYGLGEAWFEAVHRTLPEARLVAIDDLADRTLSVDLVLNQNLGASVAGYQGLVPPEAAILAGPMFALLRPEFADRRASGRVRDGRVDRILVFLSGADAADVTARAVEAVGRLGRSCDVVVGSAYPHLDKLRSRVAGQADATLHVDTDAMAALMDRADLAIGAASSASWERCALGLPAILVTLADNQIDAERRLVAAGAARAVGRHDRVSADDIHHVASTIIDDPVAISTMARAASAVTDGRGTDRVVSAIESLYA